MNGNATPDAIRSALSTLDREFGSTSELRYNAFVKRLQETIDAAEANLAKVYGEIMRLRTQPAESLGPDPGVGATPAAAAPAAASAPPASDVPAGLPRVFASMMSTIAEQLRHRSDGSHRSLADALATSPEVIALGDKITAPLRSWRDADAAGTPAVTGTADQYRVLVHVTYVWLCNKVGPVLADRLLQSAVRTAEALPDAVMHSPRQLL